MADRWSRLLRCVSKSSIVRRSLPNFTRPSPQRRPSDRHDAEFRGSLRTARQRQFGPGRSGRLTAAYERGEETDIAKVMLARQEAGVAFEATLQVRNKLLAAYQETMRMGV